MSPISGDNYYAVHPAHALLGTEESTSPTAESLGYPGLSGACPT